MKRFIKKVIFTLVSSIIIYLAISTILVQFFPWLSYHIFNQDWLRIRAVIEKSKQDSNTDTLYVGGSVAEQFFPYNGRNHLTSNGAVYPIGNYFIIRNVIENNEDLKCVVYLSVPDVIGQSIARQRTYNYFVKPFYTFENREKILNSDVVSSVLRRNKYLDLSLFDAYKLLSIDDFNYSDGRSERNFILSNEAIEWLNKISQLCKGNNIDFFIGSPPVAQYKKIESNNWYEMRKQVRGTELEELFDDYFSTIIYLPENQLRDQIHWKSSVVRKEKDDVITRIKNVIGLKE